MFLNSNTDYNKYSNPHDPSQPFPQQLFLPPANSPIRYHQPDLLQRLIRPPPPRSQLQRHHPIPIPQRLYALQLPIRLQPNSVLQLPKTKSAVPRHLQPKKQSPRNLLDVHVILRQQPRHRPKRETILTPGLSLPQIHLKPAALQRKCLRTLCHLRLEQRQAHNNLGHHVAGLPLPRGGTQENHLH